MKSLSLLLFILILVTNFSVANGMDSAKSKQRILQEFRQKLLDEEEIQRELQKNRTLTNEDFNELIKKDGETFKNILESSKPTEAEIQYKKQQELKNKEKKEEEKRKKDEERKKREEEEEKLKEEERKIKEEEKRIKEEEERIKKEEKKQQKKKTEEEKKKREEEKNKLKQEKEALKKKQKELEESKKKQKKVKELDNNEKEENEKIDQKNNTNNNTNLDYKKTDVVKSGVTDKIYNITDTGVSVEFLYTNEYKELISNKTNISKVNINKEEDIPVVYLEEKNIVSFDNSDIPSELLAYKRSENNKHIPTIMSVSDLQSIAIRAIENNNLSVLRGVIEETKDPDFLIDKNRTMLSLAIESNKYILARYLIYSGASVNRLDNKLNNPLHISVINHSNEISSLLIDNGVDINAQNIDGNTPLHLSILTDQEKLTVKLLKNGANIKIKNKSGDDAMTLSIKNNKRKIQQYLKDILIEEEMNK